MSEYVLFIPYDITDAENQPLVFDTPSKVRGLFKILERYGEIEAKRPEVQFGDVTVYPVWEIPYESEE